MLKARLDADLKTALLAGDKALVEVLRGLKSAILYEEVAQKVRDTGLNDEGILKVLAKEAKKRADSAEIYKQAGADDRAQAELSEKTIIDTYLPAPLSDEALAAIIDEIIAQQPQAQFGQIIGAVKQKVGAQADGRRIAAAVKAKM
jgi:uncharacterized protein YqeY